MDGGFCLEERTGKGHRCAGGCKPSGDGHGDCIAQGLIK